MQDFGMMRSQLAKSFLMILRRSILLFRHPLHVRGWFARAMMIYLRIQQTIIGVVVFTAISSRYQPFLTKSRIKSMLMKNYWVGRFTMIPAQTCANVKLRMNRVYYLATLVG